jgi:hypothetical protein
MEEIDLRTGGRSFGEGTEEEKKRDQDKAPSGELKCSVKRGYHGRVRRMASQGSDP